jgi:hypothetical protein
MEYSVTQCAPDKKIFHIFWNTFVLLVHSGELDFPSQEIADLEATSSFQQILPLNHSSLYRQNEEPSYRLVLFNGFIQYYPNYIPPGGY